MKPSILITFLLLTMSTYAQTFEVLAAPKVDERVELLSIAFRLADCEEYSARRFPAYVNNIEAHFAAYKKHDLINYIKNNLRKNGIGFDAVMRMAISISEQHPFQPIIPFSKAIPEERWGKRRAHKFLKLLNEFYVDADCETFFKNNRSLYNEAALNFRAVYDQIDISWYQAFYGQQPKGEFRILNGLGNGNGNYGPSITINGKEIIYAIMGTWSVDSFGMPQYAKEAYLPILVHEFNHSFVNPIVEKFHSDLAKSGTAIYAAQMDKMEAQAYGSWQTMYAEAIVRASVIKYLKDHHYPFEFIQSEINDQVGKGFIWTGDLVEALERYDNNRAQFPTLESFMPEIVRFFELTSSNM